MAEIEGATSGRLIAEERGSGGLTADELVHGVPHAKFINASSSNLDVARTWSLIDAFLDTDKVKYIFMDYSIQKLLYDEAKRQGVSRDTLDELFQYPRGKGRTRGIIRHWRRHVNHFHVRFHK